MYTNRCLTGAGRNCGIRAIVGPHGPKNQVDDVQVVTVNAGENSGYTVLARSSVRRAPDWPEGALFLREWECAALESVLE